MTDQPHYRIAYDITQAGYNFWPIPAIGLIFVAIGAGLVLNRDQLPVWWTPRPRVRSALAFCVLGFAVLWTLVAFVSTYRSYRTLSHAVQTPGAVHVAEGRVTGFKPMPPEGHSMERFCVSQTCFEYSDYVLSGGFNNTRFHGGPIREGLQVRVSSVGPTIVKLEVADR